MAREHEYGARLLLHWLNERYGRSFTPGANGDNLWTATDNDQRIDIYVAELYEADESWRQRKAELEERLDDSRPGSYVLWQPPGAELPDGEPDESEWVRRIVLGASKLASGRVGEARLPVRMALGKLKDEGGYASVTGGLSRFWTDISNRLQGSFFLDSRGLHRLTKIEEEREQLYEHIGLLSQGIETGNVVEFEHEDSWPVQRLARGPAAEGMEDGWAITGAPTGFEPNDGGATRRILRKRLAEAKEALGGTLRVPRALVLLAGYDYMENENAGPSLRGFDPALVSSFDIIALVSEATVKPLLLNRGLPFVPEEMR